MKMIAALAALVYGGVFVAFYLAQDRLIYPFDSTRMSPGEAGAPRLAEKTLQTPDGETLIVWAAPAKGAQPTILYFHGNAGNLAMRAQRFELMLEHGYGVVALAYRGSSGSTGSPSEAAITADARQLRAALPDLLGQAPRGKILYYGESLGTGVAVQLALDAPPDALLLEAPFTSLTDLAAKALPIYPVRFFVRDGWDTLGRIAAIKVPLFIIHGTKDSVVPYAHGLRVFQAATAAKKEMKTLAGADHFTLWSGEGQSVIYRFIDGL